MVAQGVRVCSSSYSLLHVSARNMEADSMEVNREAAASGRVDAQHEEQVKEILASGCVDVVAGVVMV